MELKDFISHTLTQIAQGVHEAIEKQDGKGYLVNPSMGKIGKNQTIHFDLSVETGKDGQADIKILNGGISEKSMNRISFDVDMTYPCSGENARPARPVYERP